MPSDAAVDGVAGAIGGIVATVATYPLMTVNTLQAIRARTLPADQEDVETGRQQEHQQRRRGTLHELAELARTGGYQSLFAGLHASLLGTTVSQGIYFYLYSLLRRLAVLRRAAAEAAAGGGRALLSEADVRGAHVTVAESLAVAALAGMGNVLLTNPIWMVAARMQAQGHATRAPTAADGQLAAVPRKVGIVAVARHVYREYGLSGFWIGTQASLVMVVNPTLQYALYEWLTTARKKLRRASPGGKAELPSTLEVFLLSALAKAGATLATYPMMNIKTRLYTASRGSAGDAGGSQHIGVLCAAADIARTEGIGGFYRGLRTKIVQSVLAAALLFTCKAKFTDLARRLLQTVEGGSAGRGMRATA